MSELTTTLWELIHLVFTAGLLCFALFMTALMFTACVLPAIGVVWNTIEKIRGK